MLKRLIGIVLVKQGLAVQSFGYNRYLPLGKPEVIVKNLDRWMVDEIAVISIDKDCSKPDYRTLEKIGDQGISTPLIVGGGIRNHLHAQHLIQLGADRLIVESLFNDHNKSQIRNISESFGKQALIRSCPVAVVDGEVRKYCHNDRKYSEFDIKFEQEINNLYSELLIIDKNAEGYSDSFNENIVKIPFVDKQKILFGGISTQTQYINLIRKPDVSAVGIGNFLNYTELATLQFMDRADYESSRLIDFGRKSLGEKEW